MSLECPNVLWLKLSSGLYILTTKAMFLLAISIALLSRDAVLLLLVSRNPDITLLVLSLSKREPVLFLVLLKHLLRLMKGF